MIQIKKSVGGMDLGGMYRFKAYINNKPVVYLNTEVVIKGGNEKQARALFNSLYTENGVRR
jgi:hypothetical protein